MVYLHEDDWMKPPWPVITIITSTAFAVIVFLVISLVVVARQVQYDIIGVRIIIIAYLFVGICKSFSSIVGICDATRIYSTVTG